MSALDPYARQTSRRFLYGLNPLAKLAGPLPAMIALVFVRDLATPALFLALSCALLLVGARMTRMLAITLGVALPLGLVAIAIGFTLWTDPASVADTTPLLRIGDWALFSGAALTGSATALRLGAIVTLALTASLTTTGPDLARSLVQQLRVPYRIGYAAIAAFRFLPRFAHEWELIRQAHRVRGAGTRRGPFAAIARGSGSLVPLLAGAIRHAERVALAMDARGFGAHPDRTERHLVPFRVRDIAYVVLFWAVSVATFLIAAA